MTLAAFSAHGTQRQFYPEAYFQIRLVDGVFHYYRNIYSAGTGIYIP